MPAEVRFPLTPIVCSAGLPNVSAPASWTLPPYVNATPFAFPGEYEMPPAPMIVPY